MSEVEFKPFEAFAIKTGSSFSEALVYVPGDVYDIKFANGMDLICGQVHRYRVRLPTMILMVTMNKICEYYRLFGIQCFAMMSTARVEGQFLKMMPFPWINTSPGDAIACLGRRFQSECEDSDLARLSRMSALWYLGSTFTNDYGICTRGWPFEMEKGFQSHEFMAKWEELSRDGLPDWDTNLRRRGQLEKIKVMAENPQAP